MIILNKENVSQYLGMDKRLDTAFQMLEDGLVEKKAEGRYEDSTQMYYTIQCYKTKHQEEARWEAHNQWIDVQYMRAGEERIDVLVSREELREKEWNEDADVVFYEDEGTVDGNQIYLKAGMLAVFYPEDVHRPCICLGQSQMVEKIVFKIRVNEL